MSSEGIEEINAYAAIVYLDLAIFVEMSVCNCSLRKAAAVSYEQAV